MLRHEKKKKRHEIIKFLEKKNGKFLDIGLSNDFFFYLTPKAKATMPKINKWESGSRLQSKNILNSPPLIDTIL